MKKVEEVGEIIRIYVEMDRQENRCPKCGNKTNRIHDYRVQKVKHLKWFERKTELFYRRRRYVCTCGKRFAEANSFVERYQRGSIEWNQAITIKAITAKTFKEVAEAYGTSPTTVIRRFDRIAKEESHQIGPLPEVIAIDEYKGDTEEGKYQVIIADGITREPIDILPNRYKTTIKRYLQKHGAQVQMVTMDMSPSFKAAVQEALGKPAIVADRFHFCRYIYWALDKVRRRVQQDFHAYDRKKCKKIKRIFYKGYDQLSQEERWLIERYLNLSEELERAYRLKEAYREWFTRAKDLGASQIRLVKQELEQLLERFEREGIPEMQDVIKTFKNWETEILNSFVYNYSNGFLEGINNLTKVLKRNAFGYRNFERFRAKILLSHRYKRIGKHIG